MRHLAIAFVLLAAAAPAAPAQTGWKPPSFRHGDGARDLREGPARTAGRSPPSTREATGR